MKLVRISSPTELPISLTEVKAMARLEGLDEDAVIAAHLRAAIERIEGPHGDLGRALITQTWELRLDEFPGSLATKEDCERVFLPRARDPRRDEIEIPLPPLQSIESIVYLTEDSPGSVELASSEFEVAGIDDRRGGNHRAVIRPVTSWPTADDVFEAVRIQFKAGYGDNWNDIPEPIRMAIALMVRDSFDGCESDAAMLLLTPYRADLGFA